MIQPGTPLTIEWRDLHQIEVMSEQDWHALAVETRSDVWFTPNWLAPWVATQGAGRQILAAFVCRDERLLGVLPFVIDRIYCFGIPIRLAQLAGPLSLFGVLRLPILKGHEKQVVRDVCFELLAQHKCDCVSMAPISDAFGAANQVADTLSCAAEFSLEPETKAKGHTIIRLPKTFEAYLSQLSQGRRKKYRKTKRILEGEHNITTRTYVGSDAAKLLPAFEALHQAQWTQKGKLGHFADWPGRSSLYTAFCHSSDFATNARMYSQTTNDNEIVSSLFCCIAGKSCHALLPARNQEWSSLGLHIGQHAQFERIERLIAEGIEVIDSGAGEYEYKASLKGETVDMHHFLVSHPTLMGRFKTKLLRRYGEALNLAFYRIWYNRISPKLRMGGIPVGPLWRSWIRTRV